MKIAIFTDTYLPQINGVTNTLDKLGKYLTENGIQHMVFAPEYSGDPRVSIPSPVRRFKSISCPIYPECRISIPFYRNMCEKADRFKPDLVHLVTPLGIGLAGLRYARERRIPIVSSFTTNFDVYLKYYKMEYLDEILWNYFRWFHSFCEVTFCPSQDTMETLQKKGIGNLRLGTRGIDTQRFNPLYRSPVLRQKLKLEGRTTFLFAGRLAPEKDLDILSKSIQQVNERFPGKTAFILAGDGPMADQLKETMPDNVIFTGYLRGQELSTLYASADVFAFPSGTETLGNVVLEAMASGLPVIAVNSGGVKQNVVHNLNGIMCRYRDVESFTSAIELFLTNHSLASRLGSNARQYTLSRSWHKVFDQLLEDYASVTNPRRNQLIKTA